MLRAGVGEAGGMLRNNSHDQYDFVRIVLDIRDRENQAIGPVTAEVVNLPALSTAPWSFASKEAVACTIVDVISKVARE
jgi:hypothetical protein